MCDDNPCEVSPPLKDIRERQIQDPKLMAYIKYFEEIKLTTDESAAIRLVLESKVFEMMEYCITSPPLFLVGGVCLFLRS